MKYFTILCIVVTTVAIAGEPPIRWQHSPSIDNKYMLTKDAVVHLKSKRELKLNKGTSIKLISFCNMYATVAFINDKGDTQTGEVIASHTNIPKAALKTKYLKPIPARQPRRRRSIPPRKVAPRVQATKSRRDQVVDRAVTFFKQTGLITKISSDYYTAYIDSYQWGLLDYGDKKNIHAAIEHYCSKRRGGGGQPFVMLKDSLTGGKVTFR